MNYYESIELIDYIVKYCQYVMYFIQIVCLLHSLIKYTRQSLSMAIFLEQCSVPSWYMFMFKGEKKYMYFIESYASLHFKLHKHDDCDCDVEKLGQLYLNVLGKGKYIDLPNKSMKVFIDHNLFDMSPEAQDRFLHDMIQKYNELELREMTDVEGEIDTSLLKNNFKQACVNVLKYQLNGKIVPNFGFGWLFLLFGLSKIPYAESYLLVPPKPSSEHMVLLICSIVISITSILYGLTIIMIAVCRSGVMRLDVKLFCYAGYVLLSTLSGLIRYIMMDGTITQWIARIMIPCVLTAWFIVIIKLYHEINQQWRHLAIQSIEMQNNTLRLRTETRRKITPFIKKQNLLHNFYAILLAIINHKRLSAFAFMLFFLTLSLPVKAEDQQNKVSLFYSQSETNPYSYNQIILSQEVDILPLISYYTSLSNVLKQNLPCTIGYTLENTLPDKPLEYKNVVKICALENGKLSFQYYEDTTNKPIILNTKFCKPAIESMIITSANVNIANYWGLVASQKNLPELHISANEKVPKYATISCWYNDNIRFYMPMLAYSAMLTSIPEFKIPLIFKEPSINIDPLTKRSIKSNNKYIDHAIEIVKTYPSKAYVHYKYDGYAYIKKRNDAIKHLEELQQDEFTKLYKYHENYETIYANKYNKMSSASTRKSYYQNSHMNIDAVRVRHKRFIGIVLGAVIGSLFCITCNENTAAIKSLQTELANMNIRTLKMGQELNSKIDNLKNVFEIFINETLIAMKELREKLNQLTVSMYVSAHVDYFLAEYKSLIFNFVELTKILNDLFVNIDKPTALFTVFDSIDLIKNSFKIVDRYCMSMRCHVKSLIDDSSTYSIRVKLIGNKIILDVSMQTMTAESPTMWHVFGITKLWSVSENCAKSKLSSPLYYAIKEGYTEAIKSNEAPYALKNCKGFACISSPVSTWQPSTLEIETLKLLPRETKIITTEGLLLPIMSTVTNCEQRCIEDFEEIQELNELWIQLLKPATIIINSIYTVSTNKIYLDKGITRIPFDKQSYYVLTCGTESISNTFGSSIIKSNLSIPFFVQREIPIIFKNFSFNTNGIIAVQKEEELNNKYEKKIKEAMIEFNAVNDEITKNLTQRFEEFIAANASILAIKIHEIKTLGQKLQDWIFNIIKGTLITLFIALIIGGVILFFYCGGTTCCIACFRNCMKKRYSSQVVTMHNNNDIEMEHQSNKIDDNSKIEIKNKSNDKHATISSHNKYANKPLDNSNSYELTLKDKLLLNDMQNKDNLQRIMLLKNPLAMNSLLKDNKVSYKSHNQYEMIENNDDPFK